MKRFHVHVAVDNLQENIRFYSSIFGAQPTVLKEEYAKWMIDDPRVNFAISTRGRNPGVDHLGIQAESNPELKDLRVGIVAAQAPILEQKDASCCYVKSDKYWTLDPQGIPWETFHTLESVPVYGQDSQPAKGFEAPVKAGACCVPKLG
jgi:catechol 2,3-dioxygenase-like lactoylglutathione lyase family enzyme